MNNTKMLTVIMFMAMLLPSVVIANTPADSSTPAVASSELAGPIPTAAPPEPTAMTAITVTQADSTAVRFHGTGTVADLAAAVNATNGATQQIFWWNATAGAYDCNSSALYFDAVNDDGDTFWVNDTTVRFKDGCVWYYSSGGLNTLISLNRSTFKGIDGGTWHTYWIYYKPFSVVDCDFQDLSNHPYFYGSNVLVTIDMLLTQPYHSLIMNTSFTGATMVVIPKYCLMVNVTVSTGAGVSIEPQACTVIIGTHVATKVIFYYSIASLMVDTLGTDTTVWAQFDTVLPVYKSVAVNINHDGTPVKNTTVSAIADNRADIQYQSSARTNANGECKFTKWPLIGYNSLWALAYTVYTGPADVSYGKQKNYVSNTTITVSHPDYITYQKTVNISADGDAAPYYFNASLNLSRHIVGTPYLYKSSASNTPASKFYLFDPAYFGGTFTPLINVTGVTMKMEIYNETWVWKATHAPTTTYNLIAGTTYTVRDLEGTRGWTTPQNAGLFYYNLTISNSLISETFTTAFEVVCPTDELQVRTYTLNEIYERDNSLQISENVTFDGTITPAAHLTINNGYLYAYKSDGTFIKTVGTMFASYTLSAGTTYYFHTIFGGNLTWHYYLAGHYYFKLKLYSTYSFDPNPLFFRADFDLIDNKTAAIETQQTFTTNISVDGANSGYIHSSAASWAAMDAGTGTLTATSSGTGAILTHYRSGGWDGSKVYIKFNNTLPQTAKITKAELRTMTSSASAAGWSDFTINLYSTDYGPTLTTADWGVATEIKESQAFDTALHDTIATATLNPSDLGINEGYWEFQLKDYNWGDLTRTNDYGGLWLNNTYLYIEYHITELGGVTYQYNDGREVTFNTVPYIADYNDTTWLYRFDFSVYDSNITQVILGTNLGGSYFTVSPDATVTTAPMNVTLTDVHKAPYSVWFLVPKGVITATTSFAIYEASTGNGISWEKYQISINEGSAYNASSAQRLFFPQMETVAGQHYTIRVFTVLNNTITTKTFTGTTTDQIIDIPVNTYNWQISNVRNDSIRVRVYYNNGSVPLDNYIMPYQTHSYDLLAGDYVFIITRLNNYTATNTTYFNATVNGTGYINIFDDMMVGVKSLINDGVTKILMKNNTLITPDLVTHYDYTPTTPTGLRYYDEQGNFFEKVCPWEAMTATVYNNATGTTTALWKPTPNTYDYLRLGSDTAHISGPYATHIMVNTTAGDTMYNLSFLPPSLDLNGNNVTVWANNSISISRTTTYTVMNKFYWDYYPSRDYYTAVLNVSNTGPFELHDVQWFVSFVENKTIDLDSAKIYDVNNAVYLEAGLNYDVTNEGYHMAFDSIPSGVSRTFRFEVNEAHASTTGSTAIVSVGNYTILGTNSYIVFATYDNGQSSTYTGDIVIKLDIDIVNDINPSSIIVKDVTAGRILNSDEYIWTGTGVTIIGANVGSGESQEYSVQFSTKAGIASWLSYAGITFFSMLVLAIAAAAKYFLGENNKRQAELWQNIMYAAISGAIITGLIVGFIAV